MIENVMPDVIWHQKNVIQSYELFLLIGQQADRRKSIGVACCAMVMHCDVRLGE